MQFELFKNNLINEELNQYGYTKIDFFNEQELGDLRAFYHECHPDSFQLGYFDGIHMTTWCDDQAHKEKVRTGLAQLFDNACQRVLERFRAINHVFILKNPGNETEFNVHQDWSIVDESKYGSVNIWAPLYDVDVRSGSLWVLPESHKLGTPIRGAGCLFPNYIDKKKEFESEIQSVNVRAGEALIFFHATIHGSPPNFSDSKRIVAVNSIVPEEAPLRINFRKSETDPIEVYEPNDDFVYEYENIRLESEIIPPKGKLIKNIIPEAF